MLDRRRFILAAAASALATPAMAAAGRSPIKMRALYNKDLTFSDLARQLNGKRILVDGYMAPPLKAESSFFVLTKRPMAVCPFCETSADWPDDIVAIYTQRIVKVLPFNVKIVTNGRLELGDFRDPETGFVSRVRLVGAHVTRA